MKMKRFLMIPVAAVVAGSFIFTKKTDMKTTTDAATTATTTTATATTTTITTTTTTPPLTTNYHKIFESFEELEPKVSAFEFGSVHSYEFGSVHSYEVKCVATPSFMYPDRYYPAGAAVVGYDCSFWDVYMYVADDQSSYGTLIVNENGDVLDIPNTTFREATDDAVCLDGGVTVVFRNNQNWWYDVQ